MPQSLAVSAGIWAGGKLDLGQGLLVEVLPEVGEDADDRKLAIAESDLVAYGGLTRRKVFACIRLVDDGGGEAGRDVESWAKGAARDDGGHRVPRWRRG